MNKSAIKNFSIEARKLLIKMAVTEAGLYDITKDRCGAPIQKGTDFEVYRTIAGTENRIFGDIIKKRANLVKAISEHGFESVMEEAAYTWFNRLIAVRFMEVNDYLPSRVRVLSSETGSSTPDVVTKSLDVDLNMSPNEITAVQKAKEDNKYDEAFRLLFIKQCNELNKILPGLFETTDDYMELLLKLSYTNDGVFRMLVDTVPEEDFDVSKEGQVEIIGWMYQYYNTELKDETFALLKKNVKITKERIPAATQLFTPDWIVRYMVENSLGRLWIEHLRANDDSVDEKATAEAFGWKYYLSEAEQEEPVKVKLEEVRKSYKDMSPLDIKCIDPCMGSGHILVYMFDVLMDIYKSDGYSERDAAFYILENNISGLDIDQRAYQLSYFALMMKGRGYNRRFFSGREIEQEGRTWRKYPSPDVRAIEESNALPSDIINQIKTNFPNVFNDKELACIDYVIKLFKDAKEYGSILNVDDEHENVERQYASVALKLYSLIDDTHPFCHENDLDILQRMLITTAFPLINELMTQASVMSRKFDVVVTNPPYMSATTNSEKLAKYANVNYKESKSDLFAIFIVKCEGMLKNFGFKAMITQHSWMFLSSYEKLREKQKNNCIINMLHLGTRAFEEIGGEVVQTTTWIEKKCCIKNYNEAYMRLVDFNTQILKEQAFLSKNNLYVSKKEKFDNIPGSPIAYWASEKLVSLYKVGKGLGTIALPRQGLASGNNDFFYRYWFEVDFNRIGFEYDCNESFLASTLKYVPVNKGGGNRKWYGNNFEVLKYDQENYEKLLNSGNKLPSRDKYFFEGITWSKISSNNFSCRYSPKGFVFTDAGMKIVSKDIDIKLLGALLSSKIFTAFLSTLSETMNFETGNIAKVPLLECIIENEEEIQEIYNECITISKKEWDSFEISWDFITHPFIHSEFYGESKNRSSLLSEIFVDLKEKTEEQHKLLKKNEENLNGKLIELYGLNDEINPEVDDSEVSFRIADIEREVRSFISYSIGCILGRYSLDNVDKFCQGDAKQFNIDDDNIIPITDEEYFDDDIVCKFIEFVKVVYGYDTLEQNLEFISKALGNKGINPREIIRNYFLGDFYKDHCKTYQKRPIYWLFDSGKENGFKALIYMHRYDIDTVGRIRSDYLHKTQNAIEGALKNAEYIISSSSSAVDKAKATKDRDRYIKQLSETRIYDQALAHVALQRIDIDLDDGVKHNYELFQGIEVASEGTKKQTIDLLAKL